jgi:uncharacterized protein (DUF58 family)
MVIRVGLGRRRDERLLAYVLVAGPMLLLALITGRTEAAAFAAPFALALALGRHRAPAALELDVGVETDRLVEGDRLAGTVTLVHDRTFDTRTADIYVDSARDMSVDEPAGGRLAFHLGSGETAPFRLTTQRWGRFVLGPVHVRVRDPLALVHWEGTATTGPEIAVLPSAPRLDQLLEPRSSRTVAGVHPDHRGHGAGYDFADLHSYQPGDQLRDLNRAATARWGTPIVNRHHPERSGDVVVLVDTFVERGWHMSDAARAALLTATRATWAVARAHLAAQDRVGVGAVGRIPVWLPPASGARARYAILESLLTVGSVLDGRIYSSDAVDAGRIPPAALVVFISALWEDRYIPALQRLQARGRETSVVHLAAEELLPPPRTADEVLARRLFDLEVACRVDLLRGTGINVVSWSPSTPLGGAVDAAAKAQLRRRTARAG